jgi:hypothetical protein
MLIDVAEFGCGRADVGRKLEVNAALFRSSKGLREIEGSD